MILYFKNKLRIFPISLVAGVSAFYYFTSPKESIRLRINGLSQGVNKILLNSTSKDWDIQFINTTQDECYIEIGGSFSKKEIEYINSRNSLNGTLDLNFTNSDTKTFSLLNIKRAKPYTLKIFLPNDCVVPYLSVQTSNGDLILSNIKAEQTKIISKTGDIKIENSSIDALNIDTSFGDVKIKNTKTINCKATTKSGDIIITLPNNFSGLIYAHSKIGDTKMPKSKDSASPSSKLILSATVGDIIIKEPANI